MNHRFDDNLIWHVFKNLFAPFLAAVLTAGIIWGSVREKIEALEKQNAGYRLDRIEVSQSDMKDDLQDIKHDVREILKKVH